MQLEDFQHAYCQCNCLSPSHPFSPCHSEMETFLTEQQTDNCSSWHHTENLNFFLSSIPLLEVVDSEKAKNCLKDFTARNILVFL